MRTASIGSSLVLLAALLAPGTAQAQIINACDAPRPTTGSGGWLLDVTYEPPSHPQNNLKQIALAVHYVPLEGSQALVFFLGGVPIYDGASNTFMIGEGIPALSCADADGDGLAGIVLLEFFLRDVRTGELVPGFIVPNDGELDDDGEEPVTIVIGNLTVAGGVRTRFWVFGTELPR